MRIVAALNCARPVARLALTERPYRSLARAGTAVVITASMLAGGVFAPLAQSAAASVESQQFPHIDTLELAATQNTAVPRRMYVDPIRRLLIGTDNRGVTLVDIAGEEMVEIGRFATGLNVSDHLDHDFLYLPEFGTVLFGRATNLPRPPVEGCTPPSIPCVTQRGALHVFNVEDPGLISDARIDLDAIARANGAGIKGGIGGLAYDSEHHILYVAENPIAGLGRAEVASNPTPTGAFGGVLVHAFRNDPESPESFEGLEHVWVRSMSGCMELKWFGSRGNSFGVTPVGVPYALCQPIETTDPVGPSNPLPTVRVGEAGVAQLFVGDGSPLDLGDARVVFHPVPGNLGRSTAFLDHVSDLLVIAMSGTRRTQAFVFDARRSAWVGAAVLTPGWRANHAQSDPLTGRLYLIEDGQNAQGTGKGSGIRVADVATVGLAVSDEVFRYSDDDGNRLQLTDGDRDNSEARAAFDPVTRRLFVRGPKQGVHRLIYAFQDRTPPFVPAPPRDPDAATNDIDERDATSVERIGGASAYGARVHMGGGLRSGVQEYFLGHQAWANDSQGDLQGRRPREGHRGLLVAHVDDVDFRGGREHGESEAKAVGIAHQERDPTEDEARTTYDEVGSQILEPLTGAAPDARDCQPDAPSTDCLAYDAVADRVGERLMATCRARGSEDDRTADSRDGAAVACSAEGAEARAASSEGMGELPVRIGYASSQASSRYDPDRGVVTTVESIARGVELDAPGIGSLRIGEVRTTAQTWANGRLEGAGSTLESSVNTARIMDAAGHTVWACGTPGPDDPAGRCDYIQLVDAINRAFQTRVYARGPRPHDDPVVRGSTGGALARVIKDPVAVENDKAIYGDERLEVAGLELMIVNDSEEASRLVVQLAGVYGESQYRIGAPAAPAEPLGPASLAIELVDELGEALAGGMFEVREAGDLPEAFEPGPVDDPPAEGSDGGENGANGDGEDGDANGNGGSNEEADGNGNGNGDYQAQSTGVGDAVDGVLGLDELVDGAVCVTAEDGIGTCVFEDLEPGTYQVIQTAAPDGYFPAEPYLVDAFPGYDTVVRFTNMRAVGGVEINLTDDAEPPEPLAGGEFALLARGTDEVGRCTTGPEGTCGFADVPLDDYVVRQDAAPDGRLTADDIPFTLDQPGQVAVLNIINGFEGVEAAHPAAAPPVVEPVSFRPGPASPQPVVHRTESAPRPERRSGVGGLLSLPADVFGFIARKPFEAALIIGVWLLLAAPAYLAARRRSLVIAKGVM